MVDNSSNFFGDSLYDYDTIPSVDISLEKAKTYPDIAKVSIALIICVLGLIGNLIVVFVVVVLKEYQKSVTHWYVLQLAIADAILLLTIPFMVSEDLNNAFLFPEWMCKGKETILFLNYYSSMLFLMVMSLDRYFAVCHQFSVKVERLRKTSSAFVIALIVWTISVLLSIPVLMYSYKTGIDPECKCTYAFPKYDSETTVCIEEGFRTKSNIEFCLKNFVFVDTNKNEIYCRSGQLELGAVLPSFDALNASVLDSGNSNFPFDYSSNLDDVANASVEEAIAEIESACHYWDRSVGWIIFIIFNFIVMFLIPLFVMIACYGLIVRRLAEVQMTGSTSSTVSFTVSKRSNVPKRRKHSSRSEKDRKRVTIMCSTLVACFIICWLPFHAIHLAKVKGITQLSATICNRLSAAGTLIAFLNSALNPYLYSFLGTDFSKRWRMLKKAGSSRYLASRASRKHSDSSGNCPNGARNRKSRTGSANSKHTNNNTPTVRDNTDKDKNKMASSRIEPNAKPRSLSSSRFNRETSHRQGHSTQPNSTTENTKEMGATATQGPTQRNTREF